MTTAEALPFEIRRLDANPAVCEALSAILIDAIANGASLTFMHPLGENAARDFWNASLAAAKRGERVVLGAYDGETLAGTVTLILKLPPNQPHRAEISKMITHMAYRGRGIATHLMYEAESVAIEHGRSLLVLDTATDGGASGLYERLGFMLLGEIPDYALKPHGGLTGAKFYWKRL